MNAKPGRIVIAAMSVLTFGASVLNAAESKKELKGLIGIKVNVPTEELKKAGITTQTFATEIIREVESLGIPFLTEDKLSTSVIAPELSVAVNADPDIPSSKFAVCCSLSLTKKISARDKAGNLEAITWQKNRFANCEASQLGQTAKKCLADCLDAFGREFESANPKNMGGQNMLIGKIQKINLEGGFFGIIGDDGQKYDPVNLADEFRKDGLAVKFTVRERPAPSAFVCGEKLWRLQVWKLREKNRILLLHCSGSDTQVLKFAMESRLFILIRGN